MKAYLINANSKTVSPVELTDGFAEIRILVGYATVDSDEIDASGDRLFFDERCFLRDQTGMGRFKLDKLAPVADRAMVVGSDDDGITLKDAVAELDALRARITWLPPPKHEAG